MYVSGCKCFNFTLKRLPEAFVRQALPGFPEKAAEYSLHVQTFNLYITDSHDDLVSCILTHV